MDAHLPEWLWPIALFGVLGAFIDFLLGRAGQERTRRILENWWVRFDDVRWGNFGQKEALFAVRVLDRWWGHRLFSFRRFAFVFFFFFLSSAFGYALSLLFSSSALTLRIPDLAVSAIAMTISILMFGVSLSVTLKISAGLAGLLPRNMFANLAIFACLLIISYMLTVYWAPFVYIIRASFVYLLFLIRNPVVEFPIEGGFMKLPIERGFGLLSQFLSNQTIEIFRLAEIYPQTFYRRLLSDLELPLVVAPSPALGFEFAYRLGGYLPNVTRMFISILFVGSFLFQPVVKQPLSLLWLRIVESDKPIFTLALGGVSAMAIAVSQVIRHLW